MTVMKAVIGLGNPDEQYENTRHNVGFRVVDTLAHRLEINLTSSPKTFSLTGKYGDWLLAKPQTYMNESGKAVQALMSFYKLSLNEIFIVHDDLDIPLGVWKHQLGRGPKIHNGLLSIYQSLGTKDFAHIRIGVDGRAGDKAIPGKDYVLQPFADAEETVIQSVVREVANNLVQ